MFGIFTGLLMATTIATTAPITLPTIIVQGVEAQRSVEPTEEQIIRNKIIEVFGKDANIMLKIALCESGLRQTDNGKVLVSKTKDHGVFQLNEFAHKDKLKEMGLDPSKLEDNIKYAKYLFDERGTKDWYMSAHCWNK